MKKILMSVLVIAVAVSVAVVGISGAWFSDIESTADVAGSPEANRLVAGSIDLDEIGGKVVIEDMKPCVKHWGYITLHNAGENDGYGWLHFTNVLNYENGTTDAEREAYLERSGYDPDALRYDNDLERFMTVDVYLDPDPDGQLTNGGTYVIRQDDHWKLAELECQWIPIGLLPVCTDVEVWLSFHIQDEAGNQYQTDKVTFDLEVMLQQEGAPPPDNEWPSDMRVLRLENKDSDTWEPIIEDGSTYGILTYDCAAPTFNFTFEGYGLDPTKEYNLIYYADPWKGNNPGKLLAYGLSPNAAGRISYTGSVNIGFDLPHPNDWNHPDGAKLWLVTKTDYNNGTCATGPMTDWNPMNYLFEMRLITYDDTDA
jgi:hypothetical protein